jgi:hypothetical protein
VILVLAEARDEHNAALAGSFGPARAAVVTPLDLAAEPSALHHPRFHDSWITAQDAHVPVGEIEAVITLIAAINPSSLACYDESEREYQAAELHAWLTFFLASLRCRVINPPSPLSLSGPVLAPFGWRRLAEQCGIPLAPMAIDSDRRTARCSADGVEVTVVGGEVLEPTRTVADDYALRLARHAGMIHLRAICRPPQWGIVHASAIPDVSRSVTRSALAELVA